MVAYQNDFFSLIFAHLNRKEQVQQFIMVHNKNVYGNEGERMGLELWNSFSAQSRSHSYSEAFSDGGVVWKKATSCHFWDIVFTLVIEGAGVAVH